MTSGDYSLLACGWQRPIVHCRLLGNNGVLITWRYLPALIRELDSLQNDLKGAFNAQAREIAQKKKLEQIRIKTPQNRQQIVSLNWFYCVVCCVGCWTDSVMLLAALGVELILLRCLLCWVLNWFCHVVGCVGCWTDSIALFAVLGVELILSCCWLRWVLNWFYRVVCCVGCWTDSVVLLVVLSVELILLCCWLCLVLNWFCHVVGCVGCWTDSVMLLSVLGVELILSCCWLCWLLNWFCCIVCCVSGVDLGWWVVLLFSGGENSVWVWRAWLHAALTRGRFGQMVRCVAGEQADSGSDPLWLAFHFQNWFIDAVCWLITHAVNEMFKVVHKCHCLS